MKTPEGPLRKAWSSVRPAGRSRLPAPAGALRARCARRLPEERSPQMAQMCLVKGAMFPEGWAGTLRTPLMPSGGLMSSVLLTGFMGELS